MHISWSLSIFFCVCKESFRYRRTFPFAGIVYARSPFREKKENGDSFQDLKVILEFTTGQGYHFFSIFLYRYSKPKSEHHLHKTKDQNHRKKERKRKIMKKSEREKRKRKMDLVRIPAFVPGLDTSIFPCNSPPPPPYALTSPLSSLRSGSDMLLP